MADLKEALIELLISTDDPLSIGDILEDIGEKHDVRPSTVRHALRALEDERRIFSFIEQKGKVGRPKKFYRPIEKEVVLNKSVTREAYERQNLLQELIDDSTGRYSTIPFYEVQSMFKKAAESLLRKDPRHLFIRFAEWLKHEHESEVKLYKNFKNRGLRKDAEKHRRNIEKLEKCANAVFTRMLGVPAQIRQDNRKSKPGPFILKLKERKLEDESNLEPTELKKYIEYAVYGSHVIEKLSVEGLKPPIHIGGSDTSIQPILLSKILPWLMERSEISIITAVGVRYNIFKDAKDFDRYPEPKVLAQYERSQAIEEGLLIPPSGTLGYRPEMENRIREAAMDLRQSIKDFDLMFRNEPAVKIHFRDGRIVPYEHRLSDALQIGFHGDMVRSSLRAFRNIVNLIGAENGEILYCGFVKRPGISILAPLIMWYIGFGSAEISGKSIDPEMTLEDFLRSPYSDNYIANQLFSALRDSLGDKEIYLTFRLLRRFQSMEEPYVQNFEPTAERDLWTDRLRKFNEDFFGSGSEESGADLIANLCSRAAVIQFYCSLSVNPYYEATAQLPRLEFLLPYPDFKEALNVPEKGNHRQVIYVKRILNTMFYSGVLVQYQDSLHYFRSDSPKVFFVPRPVYEAHESAKLIAKEYGKDFIELLIREARIYWLIKTRGLRGIH